LLAAQYELDLQNATEIVLAPRRHRRGDQIQDSSARPPRAPLSGGSSSRAAASALRMANSVGAVLANRRVLGDESGGPLLTSALVCAAVAVVAVLWPASIGWPVAALAGWIALNLGTRCWRLQRRRRRKGEGEGEGDRDRDRES
jgi:cardiolipin synthase